MAFDDRSLSSYIDVAQRIADFRALYPHGSLQPVDPAKPWEQAVVTGVDKHGKQFTATMIVYVAAAYRTPDDPRPGIGMAWEAFPGRTPYTLGSELMNAETSAWGRAIIAVLASDSKAGVTSRDEVRNRLAERDAPLEVDEHGAMTFAEQVRTVTGAVDGVERLDGTPSDDPWLSVDQEGEHQPAGKLPKPTGPQKPKPVETDLEKRLRNVAAMQGYFRTLGVVDRQAYLHIAAVLAGLPKIKTTKDLTVEQGRAVIAVLGKCKNGAVLQGFVEERERELADMAPA